MEIITSIIANIVSLFIGIGGTSIFFIKISKRKENAAALMSEIEAMKEKLKYYDTVFKDMEEKIVYYTNEAKTLRNIIIKKCPKCKNLEL